MKLPLLASVPHAGWRVPEQVASYCILTPAQILADGDVEASEIYAFEASFQSYATTDVGRAIVDLNRAVDDRRPDGVVKTHTCWNEPVYREFPPDDVIQSLLDDFYHPYHARLSELATTGVRCGVDLHTMAAKGPPVGPDPGVVRPPVCLSNVDGASCPPEWMDSLKDCFELGFGDRVRVNDPFKGGFITRSHSAELPWIQIELSRGPHMTIDEKKSAVLRALTLWCDRTF